MAERENIIKLYPKYQVQMLPTLGPQEEITCPITTLHNSVKDVILGLYLPDTNN